VIKLSQANEAVLDSLKKLNAKILALEGNKLTIDVENPEKENPDIINAIVSSSGRIETVTVIGGTLEDAYLKLVKENG
jgi:hypothetical protein